MHFLHLVLLCYYIIWGSQIGIPCAALCNLDERERERDGERVYVCVFVCLVGCRHAPGLWVRFFDVCVCVRACGVCRHGEGLCERLFDLKSLSLARALSLSRSLPYSLPPFLPPPSPPPPLSLSDMLWVFGYGSLIWKPPEGFEVAKLYKVLVKLALGSTSK